MSFFSKFVWNPLKSLAVAALQAVESDLQHLAGLAASQLPASPISSAAESAFEAGLQTAMDQVLIGILGQVPVVGAAVSPVAIAEANKALDYLVQKGTKGLNDLAQHAKDQLTAVAAAGVSSTSATASSGTSGSGSQSGGASVLNPTGAQIAAGAGG